MEKISSTTDLEARILFLESKKTEQENGLKQEILKTYALLKPASLIKNTFKELASSEEFKGDLLDGAIGLTAGLFAKKAVGGSAGHPLKNILGLVVQAAVSKTVAANSGGIRTAVMNFVNEFLNKKDKPAS